MSIRILICDDQNMMCENLSAIINNVTSLEIVGLASDGATLLELIPKINPDVIFMGLKMPNINGIKATT